MNKRKKFNFIGMFYSPKNRHIYKGGVPPAEFEPINTIWNNLVLLKTIAL